MRRSIVPLLATAALVLAACGNDNDSGGSTDIDLDGRHFISTSVEGYDLAPGTRIELRFESGSIGANAGCNNMTSSYALEGDVLDIGLVATTEMACDEPLMDQDLWLAEFLTSLPTVSLDGDELQLENKSGTKVELLDRESAVPDLPLEETLWEVDGLVTDDAVSSIPVGVTASIMITDGSVDVDTGCNGGSTSVDVVDDSISFGPMATTLMLCPDDEMAVQDAVLAVLGDDVTYEISGDQLTLRRTTPDGDVGLDLTAAP